MYQISAVDGINYLVNSQRSSPIIRIFAFSAVLFGAACSASVNDPAPINSSDHPAAKQMGNAVIQSETPINKRFGSLDEYLAHLELTQGPVDGPWYKKVGADMYELQTGNLKLDRADGVEEKRLFTRQELEKKFGFSK